MHDNQRTGCNLQGSSNIHLTRSNESSEDDSSESADLDYPEETIKKDFLLQIANDLLQDGVEVTDDIVTSYVASLAKEQKDFVYFPAAVLSCIENWTVTNAVVHPIEVPKDIHKFLLTVATLGHWYLIYLNSTTCVGVVYNSIPPTSIMQRLLRTIVQPLVKAIGRTGDWSLEDFCGLLPKQQQVNSCGVYCMYYAQKVLERPEMPVFENSLNVDYYKFAIASHLLRDKKQGRHLLMLASNNLRRLRSLLLEAASSEEFSTLNQLEAVRSSSALVPPIQIVVDRPTVLKDVLDVSQHQHVFYPPTSVRRTHGLSRGPRKTKQVGRRFIFKIMYS